ncbi:MAG: hypothetical protein ACLP4R_20480 [Solirubrobacteraceae bacterium]
MRYAPAMLARLTYSWAAYELSDRLVGEAGTYGDEYGRGAFLAEEAATIVSEAMALLEAAVVADRRCSIEERSTVCLQQAEAARRPSSSVAA